MSLDLWCREEFYLVVQVQHDSIHMLPTHAAQPMHPLSVEVHSILLLRLHLSDSIDVVLVADLLLT